MAITTKYDPKVNLIEGQQVIIKGGELTPEKNRPYIVIKKIYGDRFIAAPLSRQLDYPGYKMLNDPHVANVAVHKFENLSYDSIADFKFAFLPKHEQDRDEILAIFNDIISGRFNPNSVPLWNETDHEKILMWLLVNKEAKKYRASRKKMLLGDDAEEEEEKNSEIVIPQKIITLPEDFTKYMTLCAKPDIVTSSACKTEKPEKQCFKELRETCNFITIREFLNKCTIQKHNADVSIGRLFTLYSRLGNYFYFPRPRIERFLQLVLEEITTNPKYQKVRVDGEGTSTHIKGLVLKYKDNTSFKDLGLVPELREFKSFDLDEQMNLKILPREANQISDEVCLSYSAISELRNMNYLELKSLLSISDEDVQKEHFPQDTPEDVGKTKKLIEELLIKRGFINN